MEEVILIFNDTDIKSIRYDGKFYINILDIIKSFEKKNKFLLYIKNIYYIVKLKIYKINVYCKIEDIFKALAIIYNKKDNIEKISLKLLKLKKEESKILSNKDSISLDNIKLDIIKSLFK